MAVFNCCSFQQTTPFFVNNSAKLFQIMGSSEGYTKQPQLHQNVVVMRHGDRMDNVDPLWTVSAPRPWDPPLDEGGKQRAFRTGWKIRKEIGFPIHRVFVSPFLRCLQTAHEAVAALSAVADESSDHPSDLTSKDVVIDPSKIKVSIEFGLSEMLNSIAIRPNVAPKDKIFSFDISLCEAELPTGTVDNTVEQVCKELSKWPETPEAARARYDQVIKGLADRYPSENLLLVTHGEGVGSSVRKFVKDVDMVCEVKYCAYSHLRRPISFDENQSIAAGQFDGSPDGQVGVKYMLLSN